MCWAVCVWVCPLVLQYFGVEWVLMLLEATCRLRSRIALNLGKVSMSTLTTIEQAQRFLGATVDFTPVHRMNQDRARQLFWISGAILF